MKKEKNNQMSKFKHFNPMALREKYSIGGTKKSDTPFSSFWADTDWDSRRSEFIDEDIQPKKKGVDHVQLAQYRRAIANFVTIVTGDSNINVRFQNKDSSYTDGKVVTIGSKLDQKNFDPVVGLALHEGSHIKLSDFDFLRNLENQIPEEVYHLAEKKAIDRFDARGHIKNLLNYVEDRRIDYFVFSNSPGYKGYYHSMYDKYFHSKVIDKALKSNSHTDLDWDSYIMRIINLTNKNRNLNALPNLKEIYSVIFGGGRVKKLTSTEDAFNVALEVYRLVLSSLPNKKFQDQDSDGGNQPDNKMSDEDFQEMMDGMNSEDSDSDSENSQEMSGSGEGKEIDLTPQQQKQLSNAIQKQKDFINGDTKKVGTLTKKDNQMIKTMEDAGVEKVTAGEGLQNSNWDYETGTYGKSKGVGVIYVKKLTQNMIDDSIFPYILRRPYRTEEQSPEWLTNGISLGTKLGRKLQIRGESRDLKWNRLDAGRIDKRLIAELGFGNNRVFSQTFTENYSDAFLHISVDASGSMSGDKWDNTMTTVVAICKAVDMIQNVDVQVSFRSTHDSNRWGRGASVTSPLILIGYDSRVDKFNKIKKMFPSIYAGGTTPEGLCFEAIMKDIIPTTNQKDSYFLNLSDGMPMFSNHEINYYHGDALNHTKKMVNEIRGMGVNVMSYFVGGDSYGREDNMVSFTKMYGKDAEFINLRNVMEIAKTMNKKFLEK